jgi:hypothetical protein
MPIPDTRPTDHAAAPRSPLEEWIYHHLADIGPYQDKAAVELRQAVEQHTQALTAQLAALDVEYRKVYGWWVAARLREQGRLPAAGDGPQE